MTSILKVTEIQDPTNSNKALEIDSTGRILTPARPAFSCRPSSGIARTSTGWQTVDFDTVDFDIGSNLHADGYYVCPVDGIYHFDYSARFDSIGSGFLIIALASETSGTPSSSGALFLSTYVIDGDPPTDYQSMTTSTTIKLEAGDNVTPYYYTSDTSYTIQSHSSFSGFLVG